MKRQVRIRYHNFYFEETLLPKVLEVLSQGFVEEGDEQVPIQFEVLRVASPEKEAWQKEIENKYKESLEKDKSNYSRWWLEEQEKVRKLQEQLKEMGETPNA